MSPLPLTYHVLYGLTSDPSPRHSYGFVGEHPDGRSAVATMVGERGPDQGSWAVILETCRLLEQALAERAPTLVNHRSLSQEQLQ